MQGSRVKKKMKSATRRHCGGELPWISGAPKTPQDPVLPIYGVGTCTTGSPSRSSVCIHIYFAAKAKYLCCCFTLIPFGERRSQWSGILNKCDLVVQQFALLYFFPQTSLDFLGRHLLCEFMVNN